MSVLYHFAIMPAHPVSRWRHVLTPLGMWPGAQLSHQLSQDNRAGYYEWVLPGARATRLTPGIIIIRHCPAGADLGQARNIQFIALLGGCHMSHQGFYMTSYLHFKCIMTILDWIFSHLDQSLSLRVLHGLATAPLPHAWCCHALTSLPLVAPLSGKIV